MSNDDNFNEQPTQMASAGSQPTAGEGQQTWQTQNGQNANGQTQNAAGANGQQNLSGQYGSGQPYGQQYGANTSPQQGQTYGSNAQGGYGSAQNQTYGSASPQGQTYGSSSNGNPMQNQPGQQGWNSAPNAGQSYGSYGQPQPGQQAGSAYSSNNAPYGQQNSTYSNQQGQQYGQYGTTSTTMNGADPATKPKPGLGKMLGWGAVASALLTIIGCFGTWVYIKMGSIEVSGNGVGSVSSNLPGGGHSDSSDDKILAGWFIIVLALVPLVLGVLRALGKVRKPVMWAAVGASVLAEGLGLFKFFQVRNDIHDAQSKVGDSSVFGNFSAGSGWGLTLLIVAGLLMLATCIVSALRD